MKLRLPVALTIAGSDSGGGAGIEADLKTFAVFGVHGTAAITSVTAQNTRGVYGVYDLPPEAVARQIEVVAEDLGVDAAKTGMLSNKDIIEAVAKTLRKYDFPLVIDPVMVAKSGDPLLREDAVESLVKLLFPRALVVTPNRMEAEKLVGFEIRSLSDAEKAAKYIVRELGPEAAIVKGGHLQGDESVDVMFYRGRVYTFRSPRIVDGCYHGTGCAFSAAITANLARGLPLDEAVRVAKKFITTAIIYGIRVGRGHCPVNPVAWLELDAERFRVKRDVEEAVEALIEAEDILYDYIPEVGTNIAMALPPTYASSRDDVAGVLGRIVKAGGSIVAVGPVEFGASSHMARLVLAAMRHDPRIRAALNVRYDEDLVEAFKELGYTVVYVPREEEPLDVAAREGASLPWALEEAVRRAGRVPDVIYDKGGIGKEPMVRVLAPTATLAVKKLIHAAEKASQA
ncbi:MAG: bifunctional hydroxymethylpyrimidine kinase/phosphomethylpyrimidine kinase [Desulfurococcales archaeon]|nr:bifunctional hydroxymethylpyrimidine kinase/phosphomethylpyrimidine kinase [Desulfurococcales archaeon]